MDNNTQTNTDNKTRIIKLSVIILAIIIIILGIIFFIRYKKSNSSNNGSLFPNTGSIIDIITGNDGTKDDKSSLEQKSKKYAELYSGPVAGYIKLSDKNYIRLFDRNKGLIIDVNIETGEQKTVSDQPILQVHDVTFISDFSMIARSFENNTIKSNIYNFSQNQETGMLTQLGKPTVLADNILELSISKNGSYVVFVTKSQTGSVIETLDTKTEELTKVIDLPISEWIPTITDDGEVFISAKASKFANSGTYKVNNESLDVVIPAQKAQTSIISPNGKLALTIPMFDKDINPNIVKLSKEIESNIEEKTTDLRTIADKCTWNSLSTIIICSLPKEFGNDTPDDWYLGKQSYDDNIWQYDTVLGKNTYIFNPAALKGVVDAISLNIEGDKLFFKDKKSEYLYSYTLDENLDLEKDYQNNTSDISNDNNIE